MSGSTDAVEELRSSSSFEDEEFFAEEYMIQIQLNGVSSQTKEF